MQMKCITIKSDQKSPVLLRTNPPSFSNSMHFTYSLHHICQFNDWYFIYQSQLLYYLNAYKIPSSYVGKYCRGMWCNVPTATCFFDSLTLESGVCHWFIDSLISMKRIKEWYMALDYLVICAICKPQTRLFECPSLLHHHIWYCLQAGVHFTNDFPSQF